MGGSRCEAGSRRAQPKFGGPWLGLELLRRLELDRFLEETLPEGREEIPWPLMATVLVLGNCATPPASCTWRSSSTNPARCRTC